MKKSIMNDEHLERLLHQAAGEDATPGLPDDLADRVWGRLVRRRKYRRIASSMAAAMLLVAVVGIWHAIDRNSRVGTARRDAALPSNSVDDSGPPLRYGPGTRCNDPDTQSKETGAALRFAPATRHSDPDIPDTSNSVDVDAVALRAEVKRLQEEIAQLRAQIEADKARRRFEKSLASLRRELRKPDPRDLAMAEIEKAAFLDVRRAEALQRRNQASEARNVYQQVVSRFPHTMSAKVALARLNK